jgi:hypothetical protein
VREDNPNPTTTRSHECSLYDNRFACRRCKQELEVCVGGCAGTDTTTLPHSFETWVAKAMLSPDVIGEAQYEGAFANCTKKTGTVLVDLFEGGDSCASALSPQPSAYPQREIQSP